ncbi:MAG: uroporphyrinogen decarboxylase, partial [Planctomycetaceae bacterium]|nr:uroporphyrinogen decarboxylase [Planctomycetaceae bacterium]
MKKRKWDDSPMMRAVRCQTTESVPVWLMRQAGRYMPEYREIRERVSFMELCKTPELAAEVMLTAVQRLGVDAAIIFSDILLLLEPMGLELEFEPDGGPKIGNPIRNSSDVALLRELESVEPLEFVMNTIRYTREGLDDSLPLIGFAGAPFTLAAYAIEGN